MSIADANALHRMLGLSDDELDLIIGVLGRQPMPLELAMYSVMWSEHCSYKSSRIHLRRLPSEGANVLVGPGENAGVVDVGDGIAIAVRIESHNHPSAVEPYQGAATGVGGILRDVFTMGARPIALMDPLFFGELDDPRSRFIFDGVVRGISGYGNSVGVPTVGGQLTFSHTYRGNPLVNVFCLGVLPIGRLVLGRASGVGNLAVLLGSLTGRDGIGGVSVLASAGFSGDSAEEDSKRPSVQVGDPFEEKRLIEASLDLLDQGLVVGIQDLGGAGLSCATSETAARAGLGMDVDTSAVPCREPGMTPVEIMTSESQERMLAIVGPASLDQVLATCARHEVRATVIGRVTEQDQAGMGRLVVRDRSGAVVADVPAASLADEAPLYERPLAPPNDLAERRRAGSGAELAASGSHDEWPWDLSAQLLSMVYDPAFVFQQYDHQLFLNTVLGPGAADATVLRLAAPGVPWTGKGLALTTDANPGWCVVDPRLGTALTVAEAVLNVACVGGRPVAVVDCLNFGNPEHPVVMWQLSEAIDGMAEACRALGVPVVGGNVSLYNESDGADIHPTPVVGVVGVIDDLAARPPGIQLAEGAGIVFLGASSSVLGGSRWCEDLLREKGGPLAPLDLVAHAEVCEFVRSLAAERSHELGIVGIHDVADGGLALCLAEICAGSGIGAVIGEGAVATPAELFSEAPSRVVVASHEPESVLRAAESAGVPARLLGRGGGDRLVVGGLLDLSVAELIAARSQRLPDAAAHAQG
ncbi:MAG: phosphoribosylformylglycinamidine synthase subunit PurL [Acidimicrobiales bacterium]|jgi:phosphoribosylformylglycinamidine synthase II